MSKKPESMHLEAKRRGEAAYRILQEASPELAEEFRQRLHLTVAHFGGRPQTVEEAEWMLNGLWTLIDNFFRGMPLTRTDVEHVAGSLRAEGWRPAWNWPLPRGPAIGASGGMIDLREHFGIWDQCGNTRFFKKQNPWSEIYLNPLDGVLVAARRELRLGEEADPATGLPRPDADSRYTLVVRDARKAEDAEVAKAFAANQPWVKNAVEKFFYYQGIGWALDAIRKFTGQEPIPGDRDLGNFLRLYKSGAGDREKYLKEGGSGPLEEPFLEEALEAILRTMNSMDGIIVDYGRNLSQADLDEALAERGILECV